MKYPVDLSLFDVKAHNPSFFSLSRSLKNPKLQLIDFCVPCNPYFPTVGMFREWGDKLESLLKFYPTDSRLVGDELAKLLGLDPKTLVLANGSTELISWVDHLFIKDSLATPVPTFGRWTDQPRETGKRVDLFHQTVDEDFRFDVDKFIRFVRESGSRTAAICNPNNPTGIYIPRTEIIRLLDALADLDLVVVDESFIDFVEAEAKPSVADEAAVRSNVLVLKSLGKNFGLHGVRFGYAVANEKLALKLRTALPRWNLNAVAETIIFSLKDHWAEYQSSLRQIFNDRRDMEKNLREVDGIRVFPSQGNFLLLQLPDGASGVECRNHLLTEHGVFIRECGNKVGIDASYLRAVVRRPDEVAKLKLGLDDYLATRVRKNSWALSEKPLLPEWTPAPELHFGGEIARTAR